MSGWKIHFDPAAREFLRRTLEGSGRAPDEKDSRRRHEAETWNRSGDVVVVASLAGIARSATP